MNIKRGEIYLVSLDPSIGREISKTRPGLVVSNNKNNQYSGTVTILPITSKNLKEIYPFEVLLPKWSGNLPKDSKAKADQIRTIDKRRIVKLIGSLDKEEMNKIDKAMEIHLALYK
jgi:mRNA interferase MazF